MWPVGKNEINYGMLSLQNAMRLLKLFVHCYENISRINYKAEKNRVHIGYTEGTVSVRWG